MNRGRWIPATVAAVAAILLGVGAWLAISLWPALGQARELQAAVAQARSSVSDLDVQAATAAIDQVATSASALAGSSETVAWSIVERLPIIGTSLEAAGTVARTAVELASAAEPLLRSLDGETSTVGRALTVLEQPGEIAALRAAIDDAVAALAGYDPDTLRFGLGDAVREAQDSLPGLAQTLAGVEAAARPLASMLGAGEPRTWLVMSQNPAEIRGSGGLFNAYLIVRVTDGKLEIIEAGSRKPLDGEYPRAEQIPYWDAVAPDTASSWGPVLGEWAVFNLLSDFPLTGALAAAGMEQRGTPVDGVVAIDPAVIAAILAGTGPVEHKGVTVDAETAYDFFTAGIYEDFPGFEDVEAKDELGMGLTYATIDAATKRPLDGSALASALTDAIAGGHLKVWSTDPAEQAWLDTTPVAAAFDRDPGMPVVGFTNMTGGKLDLYVDRDVVVDTSRCATDGTVTVTVDMANNVPEGLPSYVDVTLGADGKPDSSYPSGHTSTYVTAYMAGTTLDDMTSLRSATLNSKPVETSFGSTEGRPTFSVPVPLDRGESATLEMEFTSVLCPAAA